MTSPRHLRPGAPQLERFRSLLANSAGTRKRCRPAGSVLARLPLPPSLRLGEAAAPPVASRGTPAGRVRSTTPPPSRLGPSPKRREGGKGNLAIQDTTPPACRPTLRPTFQ